MVDYPAGSEIQRPVLYSFISPTEIGVKLYWSRLLSSATSLKTIDNANVILYEDENVVGSFVFIANGYYSIDGFIPSANKTYKLLVDIPEYGEITAETKMPNEINPEFSLNASDDGVNLILNQVFVDSGDVENFYFTNVRALIYYPEMIIDTNYVINLSSPMYDNLYNGKGTIFHDRMINGQTYNCLINIENHFFRYFDRELHQSVLCDSAIIIPEFRVINYDFYRYYIDVRIQSYNNDNAFSEPYPVHCNVKNAYGIFAAYIEYSDSLKYVPTIID
ncbi:MAG: DUF4249 family protein [Bacteroidales bacterium]|nr:DUF4249 family protein [Bacteroidales bacterium]